LSYIFGAPAPENTVITACSALTPDTLMGALAKVQIPYSWLRINIKPLPDQSKTVIAKYAPLDTLIWYHEELVTPEVNAVILERLKLGEKPQFSYGKLMERLLYFKRINAPFYELLIPIAEERLRHIELELEPPVVVCGDSSYSMDVAIRTSTIIASVLTVLTAAELKFFTNQIVEPPCYPTTVTQVIDVATNVRADGMTAPAAALWPYYNQKKVVKFFVIVTDEIENIKFNNQHYFPALFLQYYQEIYPAKIVFVSFLENPSEKGRMVKSLENMGIEVLQFRLDGNRPDLTKMDTLLGLLSSESSFFGKQVKELAGLFQSKGFDSLVHRLRNPPQRISSTTTTTTTSTHPKEAEEIEVPKKKISKPLADSNSEKYHIEDEFKCPLTLEIMEDPVILSDGFTYERTAIEDWLKKNNTSPMTNLPLDNLNLIPNIALRKLIQERLKK